MNLKADAFGSFLKLQSIGRRHVWSSPGFWLFLLPGRGVSSPGPACDPRQAQQSPQPQGMAYQAVNQISPQLQTRQQDILEKSHHHSFALESVEAWSFSSKTLVPGTAMEKCLCPASIFTGPCAIAGIGIGLSLVAAKKKWPGDKVRSVLN